jgi:hypothetical protein
VRDEQLHSATAVSTRKMRRRIAPTVVMLLVTLGVVARAGEPLRELEAILSVNEATRKSLPAFTAYFESTEERVFESDNQRYSVKTKGHITWSHESRLVEGTKEIDRDDVGDSRRKVVPGTRIQESIKLKYLMTEQYVLMWDGRKSESVGIYEIKEMTNLSSQASTEFFRDGWSIVDKVYGGPRLMTAQEYVLGVLKGSDDSFRIYREGDLLSAVIASNQGGAGSSELVFEFLPDAGNALVGQSLGQPGKPNNWWTATFQKVGETMLPNSFEWKSVSEATGEVTGHITMRCTNMRIIEPQKFSITNFTIPGSSAPRFYFHRPDTQEILRTDIQPDGTLKFRPPPDRIDPHKIISPLPLGWYVQRHWHQALIAGVLLLVGGIAMKLFVARKRVPADRARRKTR